MHDTISEIEDKCALQDFENFNLSSENRTPQFYILLKTHKTENPELPLGYPGRPIVSACGFLTVNVSAFFDDILDPLTESLPSYIKDTTDFITKIRQLPPLTEDSFLVTLDVGSLYGNFPHNEGIEACQYFMRNGCKPDRSIQCISKLIELELTKNHFQFNNTYYIQTLGTAEGTRMAPAYASLFMGKFEKDFLESSDMQPFL